MTWNDWMDFREKVELSSKQDMLEGLQSVDIEIELSISLLN